VIFVSCHRATSFSRVTEAFGAKGIRIEEPSDLRGAVQEALKLKGGRVVVDVDVDRYALSLPPHVPGEDLR
jgi:pyruvate dehydrogenase (quinone)